MNRFARSLSLALTFALGAVIALLGVLRGLGGGELAASTLTSMAVFYLVVRMVVGRITHAVMMALAAERAERERRRLPG